jgi:hypothetical protein
METLIARFAKPLCQVLHAALLFALLLAAAPASATTIELTGGQIQSCYCGALDGNTTVELIGPNFRAYAAVLPGYGFLEIQDYSFPRHYLFSGDVVDMSGEGGIYASSKERELDRRIPQILLTFTVLASPATLDGNGRLVAPFTLTGRTWDGQDFTGHGLVGARVQNPEFISGSNLYAYTFTLLPDGISLPEPATWLLLLSGLFILIYHHRQGLRG